MRLLIITQKIDRADPVLGFVHRWVEEFSKHLKSVVIVCLQKGDYDLPGNVSVLSLGKEKWKNKLKYIFLLFYFSIRYFNRYDAVLVHMNQEYVLAAGWLWKLLGKRIYMWRNHFAGGISTDLAAIFCTKVFCTSRYSYTAKYRNTMFMPVGVDTATFRPDPAVAPVPSSILSLGRIAPSKNLDCLVGALALLKAKGVKFTADIYGNPPADGEMYAESLKKQVVEAKLAGQVKFYKGVPNRETVKVYSAHQIFVNLSPNGMYDKTIFEAMACGCFVFASNDDLRVILDDALMFRYNDPADLAEKITKLLALTDVERTKKAANIAGLVQTHSLTRLADELTRAIQG